MTTLIQKVKDIDGCAICGDDLIELSEPIELKCDLCNNISLTKIHCVNHHYICDNCQESDVFDFITKICLNTKTTDPLELAVKLMNSPLIRMHGPEHHLIVPAVLFTCVNNLKVKSFDLTSKLNDIKDLVKEKAPVCSFNNGYCSAVIGAGFFIDLLTGITDDENIWSEKNKLIKACAERINQSPGPRCCKKDTYLTIIETVEFLKNNLAIELPLTEAKCTFSLRNSSCGREDCMFYNLGWSIA